MPPPSSSKIDLTTTTIGAGYDLVFNHLNLGLGLNYDYSSSDAILNSYTSHSLAVSSNYTLLQNEKSKLRANASFLVAFNSNRDDTSNEPSVIADLSIGDDPGAVPTNTDATSYTTNNASFSTRVGLDFNYRKQHHFQLNASLSNYSDNIIIGQRIAVNTDLRLTLSYTFTFGARIIKAKKDTKEEEQQYE